MKRLSVERLLPESWQFESTEGGDDLLDDLEPYQFKTIATHDTGAELTISPADGMLAVNCSQPVASNGWIAQPTTDSALFESTERALGFIEEVTTRVHTGEGVLNAIAIVPHAGADDRVAQLILDPETYAQATGFAFDAHNNDSDSDTDNTDRSGGNIERDTNSQANSSETDTEAGGLPVDESLTPFADVFGIHTGSLDKHVSLEDLRSVREPLVNAVFNPTAEIDTELQELESLAEGYASLDIQVYTVSYPSDLQPAE